MVETICVAKHNKELTWEEIADTVGLSPVYVTSACLGQSSMPRDYAEKLAGKLELPEQVIDALTRCPNKGTAYTVPTDPLIYRFHEIMQVYGESVKQIIHEKFGDGIMSAIDFKMDVDMDVDREEDPKGDRVVITINGKFLPCKIW